MEEIIIHHNDDLGYPLWSVCLRSDYDNWLDSFKHYVFAFDFAVKLKNEYGFIIKEECSITGCKVNHKRL